MLINPFGKSITACLQFAADILDAGHLPRLILHDQPFPERWTEVEPVVLIFGLNKDVRIEKVTVTSQPPLFDRSC